MHCFFWRPDTREAWKYLSHGRRRFILRFVGTALPHDADKPVGGGRPEEQNFFFQISCIININFYIKYTTCSLFFKFEFLKLHFRAHEK